jgi:uncharacterized protein (DUF1330 family)
MEKTVLKHVFLLATLFLTLLIFVSMSINKTEEVAKNQAAYCLFDNVEITNPEKLEQYKKEVFSVVQSFGGEYVVAGGQMKVIEGDWEPHFLVMIKFPSYEMANKWYDSEAYHALKALRKSSGQFNGLIMQGL